MVVVYLNSKAMTGTCCFGHRFTREGRRRLGVFLRSGEQYHPGATIGTIYVKKREPKYDCPENGRYRLESGGGGLLWHSRNMNAFAKKGGTAEM